MHIPFLAIPLGKYMRIGKKVFGNGDGKNIWAFPESKFVDPDAGKKLTDYNKLGYLMAKGEKGTNWMAFTESNAKELAEQYEEPISIDNVDEYSREWTTTEQYNYEVADHIRKDLKSYKEDASNEAYHEKFFELEGEWVAGYTNYVMEFLQKKGYSVQG